jgi:hypothetical protein
MAEAFIKRIWKKPPLLFPLIAVFHFIWLAYSIWNYNSEPFPSVAWVQPLWILAYAVSWLFTCDLKKWAALAYIGLATLNMSLRFILTSPTDLSNFTDTIFPIDVLFCFFLLFYFRKFE